VTNINDFSTALTNELVRYSKMVKEDFEKAKKETAKNLVQDLKATSPENRPRYKKGWAIKKVKDSLVVHNKTDYQLTHLLEKGHVKRGGGGRVPAHVHIRPAEEKNMAEFLQKVEKAINND
jgi:hypothetical protein